jgi:hypothetical protein
MSNKKNFTGINVETLVLVAVWETAFIFQGCFKITELQGRLRPEKSSHFFERLKPPCWAWLLDRCSQGCACRTTAIKLRGIVVPAKAGIHLEACSESVFGMDPRLRGEDNIYLLFFKDIFYSLKFILFL